MSVGQFFGRIIADVEHAAEAVVHFTEKELAMIPQSIADALAKIKAALSAHHDQGAADAQTITGLQGQVADLTSQGQAKDAQIADLTQQLSDATAQLADIESAVIDAANAAA